MLWVCNIMLPAVARALGQPYSVREGWLTGTLNRLLQEETKGLELGICFPMGEAETNWNRKLELSDGKGSTKPVFCYGFAEDLSHPERYDEVMELRFAQILADFQPDLVHLFGTEFPHAYACAKVFGRPARTLVSIQGLCGPIARAYMADLPKRVQRDKTLRDVLRKDSLQEQQQKFRMRGEREEKLLHLCGHVAGRTAFDRSETMRMHPGAVYHELGETMRDAFYQGKWELERCERGQIFLSQGDYPLKGFHYLLEAAGELLPAFPEVKIVVAGNSILGEGGLKNRLKIPAYGKYLRQLIRTFGLKGKVQMLGRLEEEEMKKVYLSSHLVVCPSALENSPNSVAEAMLLGVPVAAARTGGIPSMITDGEDGLLFEKGNVSQLKEKLRLLLTRDDLAKALSEKERERARKAHDGEANYRRLWQIYETMVKGADQKG